MDRLSALYRQYEIFSPNIRCIADIGTDHGYLPLKILEGGFDGELIVTDIGFGPLSSAKKNIGERAGVEFRQCSGLNGNFSDVDLFFVAGMGGDLISEIVAPAISDAALHNKACRFRKDALFVLQPMTNFEKVFGILDETKYLWSYFANERNKHYRIIVSGVACVPHNLDLIKIPLICNFGSTAATQINYELILRENIMDAIDFFESRILQQKRITESAKKSGDKDLMLSCEKRMRDIKNTIEHLSAEII